MASEYKLKRSGKRTHSCLTSTV